MLPAALLLLASGPAARLAAVEITPPGPLPMGGYTARGDAEGRLGDERLWCRVLLIEEGGRRLALAGFDGLTVPESLADEVQSRAPEGIEVWLGATHTHCAPDTQMANKRMAFRIPGIAPYRPGELDRLAGLIAEGIRRAASAEPLPGAWSLRRGFAHLNRGRRAKAAPDPSVWRWEKGGRPVFGLYAAHATVLGSDRMEWSGDWPGRWAGRMEAPVWPGAIGDVSPAGESPAAMAEGLQAAADAAPPARLSGPLRFASEPILLGSRSPSPAFIAQFGAPEPLARVLVERFAPESGEVRCAALGSSLIIAIPGEPASGLGRRIVRRARELGWPNAAVASHVGGWIGYILEAEDLAEGGYEAGLAFHGAGAAQAVYEAAERAIIRLGSEAAPRAARA